MTNDLGGWVERMKKAAAKYSSKPEALIAIDPIEVDVLAAWPWPGGESQAMTRMMEEFSEGELLHA
jgi:hypothetical protein